MHQQLNHGTPLVTVVMPVYNQERYVREAIDSVLSQTFKDFEFIAVDDGSTDGTVEVLASVKDRRFRYLRAPHEGFIRALVRGYVEARGKWIARMDSDDLCHPDRLRLQMEFLAAHPECVFVGTKYGTLSPNGYLAAAQADFEWRYVEPAQITLGGRVFGDPTTVFNKATAEELGFFDPDFENENPLWYRMLSRGKGAVLGQDLYYMRWRLGSVSRSNFEANSRLHVAVRHRYDAANAVHLEDRSNVNERTSLLSKGRVGVFLYLTAGDRSAARELAMQLWRRWPLTLDTNRLMLQAVLGVQHFRFWRPKNSSLVRVNPRELFARSTVVSELANSQ